MLAIKPSKMNHHPKTENRFAKIPIARMPELIAAKPAIAHELSGSGPAVVFVHGLTYDRSMWQPVIAQLRGALTCLAIDLPGHGESADAASYSLESVARSLHELIVHLKLDAPILVGHSAGAILVSIYAATYPVSGIVTSDQKLHTTDFITRLQGMRGQLESPAFPAIWRAIESSFGIGLIPEKNRPLVTGHSRPRQEIVLGYWHEIFLTTPPEMEKRFRSLLSKINAPFAGVFGSDVEPGYRAWLNAVLPHHELIVFTNA